MQRYEKARDEVVVQLRSLEDALAPDATLPVRAARERLERDAFVLAVVGEFSSGKSFLLNALLGKFRYEPTTNGKTLVGLLATDINPSTAAITELAYNAVDEAFAEFEDGRRERIPLDRLNRFIAVADGSGAMHASTGSGQISDVGAPSDVPIVVRVGTNSPFLQRGFLVADTPGLASANPAHRRATLGFLPSADAVLYLIDTQQPFTEGDAAFLGIIRQHIDSIFIVQTKIDLWQQPQSDGRPAWQHAHDRIAALTAVHAPGTYVYGVSARDFAEGTLETDSARVEASRFPVFLAALDASLIANTGRARLRRAHEQATLASTSSLASIDSDRAMLQLDAAKLRERQARESPEVTQIEGHAVELRTTLARRSHERRATIEREGEHLYEDAENQLAAAFDIADVARLRDRARLHILIDRVFAAVAASYAQRVARSMVDELEATARNAGALAAHFSLADPFEKIVATIVLDAIGGPAITVVEAIASRFAAQPPGGYMKRELFADLRSTIFPQLRNEIGAFARQTGAKLSRAYDDLAGAIAANAARERDLRLGSIDRALAAYESGQTAQTDVALSQRRVRIERARAAVGAVVDAFLQHAAEIAPADAGSPVVRVAHAEPVLDRESYGKGLRPQRWRVAVLGALRRGKSNVINAFAGKDVLRDDAAGSAAFPVHVRYSDRDEAFALDDAGNWNEIAVDDSIEAASKSPVLRLTPWKHPHELVLVHAPAFDSGQADAEDVNMVIAGESSAVLCLFSRQLSDRELALYERVSELGKPMFFVHTIADNETPSERRNVLELAKQYLAERKIPASRVFTVSSHEFMDAANAKRAAAPWNEMGALIATVEGQAESHMARLARLERATVTQPQPPTLAAETPPKSGLLARLFGRKE